MKNTEFEGRRGLLTLLATAGLLTGALVVAPVASANTISPAGCDTNGLALNISRSPAIVHPGDVITYSGLTVTNTAAGACDVTGATVTLTLPNDTTGLATGAVIVLSGAGGDNFPAGSTTPYPNQTYTVPLGSTYTTATASIASTGGLLHDSNDVDDFVNISKTVSVAVIHPSTTLSIVGSAPTSAVVGSSVTITVNEKNNDIFSIHGVSVTGTPASCATWTPVDAGFSGTLAGGASENFTCTFTMPASTVNWSADGQGLDVLNVAIPTAGEHQEGVITPSVSPATTLTVVGTAPTTANVGSSVTITVNEKNTSGDGNAITGVSVTGTPASCATWTPVDAGFTGTLADGASENFTCTFTMPASTVNWSADGHGTDALGQPVPATGEHAEGSVRPNITPATTLTVVGTAPTTANVGSSVTITVNEKNTSGDGNAITAVSVTGTPAACATWTPVDAGFTGTLADGASENFTCTFTMPASTVNWSALGHGTDVTGTAVPATGESQSGRITVQVTGQILPTNTECSDFVNQTTPALPGINYSLNGAGKIGQNINPGVFFYYTYVTTTVPNQVINTSQHATNSSPLFSLNQGNAWIYTAPNCALVSQPSGTTTLTATIKTPGTYVIRMQYSTKSIAGLAGPSNGALYTFDINGTDNASVPLIKQ